jgi:hypothetical protein
MRVRIGDLRSGRRILDLPFMTASWTDVLNDAEDIRAKVTLNDRQIRQLDLYNASLPGKTFIVVEDEQLTVGGIVWSRNYDRDAGTLELIGKGIWSWLDHRVVLPPMADTDRVTNEDGSANVAFDTGFSNADYSDIARGIVAQMMSWDGGSMPVVLPAILGGTHTENYTGAELNLAGDMMRNLTGLEDGPDIRFVPRRTADGLGYEWLLMVGAPRITSTTVTEWDMSVPKTPITGLTVQEDASSMAAQVWASGGRGSDSALIERVRDETTLGQGFPLFEKVKSLSNTVKDPATAIRHGMEEVRTSQAPTQVWDFKVRRDNRLGIYGAGFPCRIKTHGDPFIPDGWHDRRIMAMSGSSDSDDITIKTAEVYDG